MALQNKSELIAEQLLNANINRKAWGNILFNVKAYGAVGDDEADDTEAIQAAHDAAYNAAIPGGGVVYFPPNSTYKVTSTIVTKPGVYFEGGSRRSTIIKSYIADGSPLFERALPSPDTSGSSYFSMGFYDLRLEGYGSDGAGAGCGNAIHIADTNKVTIERVDIMNFPDATGLYVRSGAFLSSFRQMEIAGCRIGVDVNGASGTPNKVTMIHFEDVMMEGSVSSLNVYNAVTVTFQRCTIQNATDTSTGDTGVNAMIQLGELITFRDCWFERSVHDAIRIKNSSYVNIEDCHLSSAGYTGGAIGTEDSNYYYVRVYGTSKAIGIRNNKFYQRNGTDIRFEANVSYSLIEAIPKTDNSNVSLSNDASNTTNYYRRLDSTGLVFSSPVSVNKLVVTSTDGMETAGGDGANYQFRVDGNKKPYVRRASDGISRATGDVHYGGSTANRPASPLTYESYFDTTLGKPIWWNGTNWKDAAGTTV